MLQEIKTLCDLNGISGREEKIREYIIEKIKDKADVTVDALGNVIAFVKGKKRAVKKVMVDAHMDEVGLIITAVCENGTLKFATVGGIDVSVLLARKVIINDNVLGVICSKPVHMLKGAEKEKMPEKDSLYIDIGVDSKQAALELVSVGDSVCFHDKFDNLGNLMISKALDDRIGCAILLDIISKDAEYDFYATFTTQEEVGLRGAKTAAFTVEPDFAIVVESTTAADIAGVSDDKKVCCLGKGATLSFMDSATLYDYALFEKALNVAKENGIKCQVKCAVAGGNNAGAIHQNKSGVKTVAISVPCRYIHSPSCVASYDDVVAVRQLVEVVLNKMASGEIQ